MEAEIETVPMDDAATTRQGGAPVEQVTVAGPGGDLVVVGVSWAEVDAGAGLTAKLRSRDGETWSAWTDLEITAPVSVAEAHEDMRGGTEPLAVMDADEVEVTLTGAPGTCPPTLSSWLSTPAVATLTPPSRWGRPRSARPAARGP
ncbi:hypothetical protein [Georgenia yuyongxinii]